MDTPIILSDGYCDTRDNYKLNLPWAWAIIIIDLSNIDFTKGYEKANQYENMFERIKWDYWLFHKLSTKFILYEYPLYKVD